MNRTSKRLNEFELDNEWQSGVFNRLLREPLRQSSYDGGVIFVEHDSPIAKLIQHRAHADILVQIGSKNTISIECKLVRFPRRGDGQPGLYHWRDFFLKHGAAAFLVIKPRAG